MMNVNVKDAEAKTLPVTRMLAEFATALRYEDLPPDLILNAKQCIRDSLGCGVYGANMPWVQSVKRVVTALGQSQTASAWGMKVKADPLGAAFINGTAAQGFELDDCHDQSMSHYGAGVIPAVLASAEGFGHFTGKDVILAVVAGYELGTRIGNTVSPSAFHRGFHPCGLTSTFGSAAAIAKLLKLDTDQYVSALGLAGSQAAGLMASQFGAMAKRFHSGKASQNGIIAALCAKEGLTGVRDVLEAPYGGFCSTYSEKYDLSWATKDLGTDSKCAATVSRNTRPWRPARPRWAACRRSSSVPASRARMWPRSASAPPTWCSSIAAGPTCPMARPLPPR